MELDHARSFQGRRADVRKMNYQADKERMISPVTLQENKDFRLVKLVAEISQNEKGDMGIVLARDWKGTAYAVKRINADGVISVTQPEWTKKRWAAWKPRRFALIEAVVTKMIPNSMKPLGQQILQVPVTMLEMDTRWLPVMTEKEWTLFVAH